MGPGYTHWHLALFVCCLFAGAFVSQRGGAFECEAPVTPVHARCAWREPCFMNCLPGPSWWWEGGGRGGEGGRSHLVFPCEGIAFCPKQTAHLNSHPHVAWSSLLVSPAEFEVFNTWLGRQRCPNRIVCLGNHDMYHFKVSLGECSSLQVHLHNHTRACSARVHAPPPMWVTPCTAWVLHFISEMVL